MTLANRGEHNWIKFVQLSWCFCLLSAGIGICRGYRRSLFLEDALVLRLTNPLATALSTLQAIDVKLFLDSFIKGWLRKCFITRNSGLTGQPYKWYVERKLTFQNSFNEINQLSTLFIWTSYPWSVWMLGDDLVSIAMFSLRGCL